MPYQPPKEILRKYAQVLVNFALGGGKGIKKGDVVYLHFEESAKPLALEIFRTILISGGHPLIRISSEDFQKIFFETAKDNQLEFVPKKFIEAIIETIDHRIGILSSKDPLFLKNIDPEKIVKANKERGLFLKLMLAKEDQGKLTWTLALYGTPKMAQEARLSLKEYWNQIIKACFLNERDPLQKWKETFKNIENLKKKLNALKIRKIRIVSQNTDLYLDLGEKRKFVGGSGRNIPSFEVFTSPDWRGTEGKVYFDFPLYRYGNIIKGIYLEFREGKVIKVKADKNQKLIEKIISQKNADKIGEFSLTDKRLSRIDKFMANTLYDENFGGNFGNMHLALGNSYHDTYDGDPRKLKDKDWEKLGFNSSSEHCDIIQTQDRKVYAVWDNQEKLIYEKGIFLI